MRSFASMTFVSVLLCATCLAADDWVGKKMPEFQWVDQQGKAYTSQSLKGRVIIVDVWAQWCMPCRKYMPGLEKLSHSLAGEGVTVLGVNVDKPEDHEKALVLFKKLNLSFPTVFDPQDRISRVFEIDSIPRTLVMDEHHTIRFLDHPEKLQDLVTIVSVLLKAAPGNLLTNPQGTEDQPNYWIAKGLALDDNSVMEVNAYQRALKLDPNNRIAHRLLGALFTEERKYAEGLPHLEAALGPSPENPTYRKFLVSVYIKTGLDLDDNSDVELGYYQRAAALDPRDLQALELMADVYRLRKKWKAAAEAYQRVLDIDNKVESAQRHLGDMLMLDQDLGGAKEHYQQAASLDPRNFHSHEMLAEIAEKQGDQHEAVVHYGAAVRLLNDRVHELESDRLASRVDRLEKIVGLMLQEREARQAK